MSLSKHLVLFRYLLRQFGFDTFEQLRERFQAAQPGYDASGRSYFAGALLAERRALDDVTLLRYDEAIKEYEEALVRHRHEPYLSLKYYQYFALLFTEYFLDELAHRPLLLLQHLNAFKATHADFKALADYEAADLKKLAYWMATGSGKTLLLHANYRQINKYFRNWENILLITPNEGLSLQHYEELRKSGIKAKLYTGSEESLKTQEGEVLIIEITKLTRHKQGEGVSVDVDYFAESRNLVFIDEGHKGQRSEEQAWKKLREHLTRGEQSFTFEYSATFGQIIGNRDPDLLNEYGKAIVFDYSYRHFYTDGYGKDFSVFNIQAAKNEYSDRETQLLLTGSLLGFYEQLVLFEQYQDELQTYNIEKPLWVFVGSKVIGKKSSLTQTDKKNVSDVSLVLHYFRTMLASPATLQEETDTILSHRSGLNNAEGDDIFRNRFQFLKVNPPTAEAVLQKVFQGAGALEGAQIKQADGEIGLRTSTGLGYFGVINIGDVPSFVKKLEEDTQGAIQLQDDHFSASLFQSISTRHSTINILIGSKKFIEGWNSWRVSSMGLMNMGRGEGAQIIQLFGRGVRLKGRGFSLKREEATAPYHLRALQTISIFGLNADYMSNFLTNIEKEVEKLKEVEFAIQFNEREKWEDKIYTFRTDASHDFRDFTVVLEAKEKILQRVQLDLRPKVALASSGFNNQFAEPDADFATQKNPLHTFQSFINYEALTLSINQYRYTKNYPNLVVRPEVLRQIIQSPFYKLLTLKDQVGLPEALSGKIQSLAETVVKDYTNKFYTDKEKDYLTKNLALDRLTVAKYPQVFPENKSIRLKFPEKRAAEIEALLADLATFYTGDTKEVPSIHFDHHLYSPIAAYRKGKEDIKGIPVKLNEGETQFVMHLREYLISEREKIADKEIFILRNLSRRGIGFFIESSSFYPDFIIWVVEEEKQTILFVDPKGILMLGNFKSDKVVFCTDTIAEINAAVKEKVVKEALPQQVELKAFLLSVTSFENVKASWAAGSATKQDFADHNILFVDNSKEYLLRMFAGVL